LHNSGQASEMTMVEFGEMRDKQSQQRRRRADGAIRSVADRSAVEEDRALAPQAAQTTQRWSSVDRESSCAGRDSLDSAERGSLAGPAGEIPASFDVLAATARLGGAGRLVEYLANVFERVKRAPAIEMERIVSGRQFRSSEKRGCGVGKTKRGKGTKWMVVVDGRGLPLGNYLHSASPAEVKLAETTLATIRVGRSHHAGRPRQKPMRVIADKAYDSDPLRERLRQRGIELICPHKRNRVRPATQDGRVLRRYQRRWIVERTNAWLGNFRRLVVRYDRSLTIYGAFFHIACFMIVLRRVVQ
jgi:transposase